MPHMTTDGCRAADIGGASAPPATGWWTPSRLASGRSPTMGDAQGSTLPDAARRQGGIPDDATAQAAGTGGDDRWHGLRGAQGRAELRQQCDARAGAGGAAAAARGAAVRRAAPAAAVRASSAPAVRASTARSGARRGRHGCRRPADRAREAARRRRALAGGVRGREGQAARVACTYAWRTRTYVWRTTSGPPRPWRRRASSHRGLVHPEHAGARQRPDDPDVGGDDQDRPERIVRQEEEVVDRAQHRQRERDDRRPGLAGEEREAGQGHEDAEDQVDPAPLGDVEAQEVVARQRVELVVADRRDAVDDLEGTD